MFANTFLLTYAALFPIINPIGNAPIFLSLTQFQTDAQRGSMSRCVARNSFFLLLGSIFVGSHVLEFFGISLPVLRIAGGLVVTAFGWNQLNSATREGQREAANATATDSFYPLTMPLTVGPGSISVASTLGSQFEADSTSAASDQHRSLLEFHPHASWSGLSLTAGY